MLDLGPTLAELSESLLREPKLSDGIGLPAARKVVLKHALDLHAGLIELDAFRRPMTDMQVDADACIEASRQVVDLMQAEQAAGAPPPPSPGAGGTSNPSQQRRGSVANRTPQVLARMLESNRVQVRCEQVDRNSSA